MDKSITHPYKAEERKDKSNKGRVNNRKGRVNERSIMNKIYKGQANKSSIGNDGVIKLDTLLEVEVKTRLKGTPKWPTKKEWDKFISKGLDIFIVDSGDGDIRCSMTLDTLNSLIDLQSEKL
jgi:hypothetical protein